MESWGPAPQPWVIRLGLKPKRHINGWRFTWGDESGQDCVYGFGMTVEEAMVDFDRSMNTGLEFPGNDYCTSVSHDGVGDKDDGVAWRQPVPISSVLQSGLVAGVHRLTVAVTTDDFQDCEHEWEQEKVTIQYCLKCRSYHTLYL